MNRRNAVMLATSGLTATRAPATAQEPIMKQVVQRFQVTDAETATNLLTTLTSGGEGCGKCSAQIVAFSLTPNANGFDLIVVTNGPLY